ncbi:MAG TPA: beta-propeller fold lactonase family protein [Candidatus Acidoferrum sp.]
MERRGIEKGSAVLVMSVATALLYGAWPGMTTASGNSWPRPQSTEASSSSALDFNTYRTRIEPIFLKKRQGEVRCYDCHSVMNTRLRLQPLTAGDSTWSEAQSRANFEVVSRLVTPHEPMKSRLLLHPLAPEAGGDPQHTGGKFWASVDDPEWKMIAEWVGSGTSSGSELREAKIDAATDDAFRAYLKNVEPIFLRERAGHARCYGCHSEGNRAFHLEHLTDGAAGFTAEQSRRNFDSVMQLVLPGDPAGSRLLMHPLAPEAGGEAFHSGGRQFASQSDPDWLKMADWVNNLQRSNASPLTLKTRIYITNSAGSTVDVVDPATNKVVQTISGIELPHGVVFSPDGSRVYISNEAESVVDVVDGGTGKIREKVPLSGHPNNLTITKDGKRLIVGIRSGAGSLEVIDTVSLKTTKKIPVNGSVHNVYVTPDGKYAVCGSIEAKTLTVVDLQTEEPVWKVNLGSGVRPMAFEANADGSTKRIFAQLSGFNGFAIVDFAKRAEVGRIKLPDEPGGYGVAEGRTGTPSHGIGVSPDGKFLWVASTAANAIFQYALPSLELTGHVNLPQVHPQGQKASGSVPEWVTFTPDGKYLYLSNSGDRSVSAIDTATRQIVAIVPAGEVPKRINTMVIH